MMKLNIDIPILIYQLTPRVLRKARVIAFLKAATKPFQTLNASLVQFGNEMELRSKYNSQTKVLEKLLNDTFDNETRRITIENSTLTGNVRLYNRNEGPPVYLWNRSEGEAPTYLFNYGSDYGYDFTVYVPTGVFSNNIMREIEGWVNWLRTAGSRYRIMEQ